MRLCRFSTTSSCLPFKKAMISSSIWRYCPGITLPVQGARHSPIWYRMQGRCLPAMPWPKEISCLQVRSGKELCSTSSTSRTTVAPM